jgi:hypothetical protein
MFIEAGYKDRGHPPTPLHGARREKERKRKGETKKKKVV